MVGIVLQKDFILFFLSAAHMMDHSTLPAEDLADDDPVKRELIIKSFWRAFSSMISAIPFGK